MKIRNSFYAAIICSAAIATTPAFAIGAFHIGGDFAGAAGKLGSKVGSIGSKMGSATSGLTALHATANVSGKGSEAVSVGGTPKLDNTPSEANVTKAVHEKLPGTGTTDDGVSTKNGSVSVGEYASVKGTVHKVTSSAKKVKGVHEAATTGMNEMHKVTGSAEIAPKSI
jgi:hypothetical protein